MPDPMPLILDNASLKISDDGTVTGLTELACLTNHLELSPEVSVTTLDTFCGSKDYPGNVKWSLIATLYQSFDPDATEEVLSAAVEGDVPVDFQLVGYRDKPVSATNPMWTGELIPQPYAPINGDAGDASTVELEWSLTGPPEKLIVPPTGLLVEGGHSATPDETWTLAELQAEAGYRGLPTSGTKAELIERLTAA